MSAQGGTLGRLGTVHVPIWPVAILLTAAIASAIALSTIGGGVGDVAPAVPARSTVLDAVNPGMWTLPQAEAFIESQVTFPRGLEHAGAYPVPVTIPIGLENPGAVGISQVTEAGTYPVGLENPGAYGISQVTEAGTYPVGLENPGAYPADTFTPKAGGNQPIMVNGRLCGQCR